MSSIVLEIFTNRMKAIQEGRRASVYRMLAYQQFAQNPALREQMVAIAEKYGQGDDFEVEDRPHYNQELADEMREEVIAHSEAQRGIKI